VSETPFHKFAPHAAHAATIVDDCPTLFGRHILPRPLAAALDLPLGYVAANDHVFGQLDRVGGVVVGWDCAPLVPPYPTNGSTLAQPTSKTYFSDR
jgi:hypothetical protein